jgi:hypothetical protein
MAQAVVAALSLKRYGFDTRGVHVGFVVKKVAPGEGFLLERLVSSVIIIPPCYIPTHSSISDVTWP